MVVGLQQCRTARAAIARIGRGAHGASASHLWDARGGAGAEKVKFHVRRSYSVARKDTTFSYRPRSIVKHKFVYLPSL